MKLSKKDFYYELPPELVAHRPLEDRSAARLLVARHEEYLHAKVNDLQDHLPPKALVVRNNSRVIPSRMIGQTRHGGKIEVMLIEPLQNTQTCKWKALGKPMKKLKPGTELFFGETIGTIEEVIDALTPYFTISFPLNWDAFYGFVESVGYIPLPPYIKRDQPQPASLSEDTASYQTVYANPRGSVAAPTAGLHFTQELCQKLAAQSNIKFVDVTLHVGAGTFLPVKSESIQEHEMHKERYLITQESWESIFHAYQNDIPIFAVGTTTFRSVESFLSLAPMGQLFEKTDQWHSTDLFIYPKTRDDRYQSKVFSGMMTNFHQPESTLIMLIAALMGFDKAMEIYNLAMANGYRFYSYGDSSLLYFPK